MSDDVARAVGSGSHDGITINGKHCHLRPLSIRELGELERDCLKHYQRSYLQTFVDNKDIIPDYDTFIAKKADECARWDVADLPKKYVYDVSKVEITTKLIDRLVEIVGTVVRGFSVRALTQVIMNVLDKGALSPEEFEEITGKAPKRMGTGYVNWWITADPDGMVALVYHGLKNQGVSREEILEKFSDREAELATVARDIESVTTPSVGNG